MYSSLVWTFCSKEDLNRVFTLQKHAARVILPVDTRSRTVDNFKMLGWIQFYDEIKRNKCVFTIYAQVYNAKTYSVTCFYISDPRIFVSWIETQSEII